LYNQLAKNYQNLYGEEQSQKYHQLQNLVKISNSNTVLDLVCGNGTFSSQLARPARFVVSIDLSEKMVHEAKRVCEADSRCQVILGDAENLPFRKDSFEIVFAITVILNPAQAARGLSQAKRILGPKGILAITMIPRSQNSKRTLQQIRKSLKKWRLRKFSIGTDLGFIAKRGV
jgi:demethylmenaquinone methyltransferase/2-methoxy-6-polyprenyl-1,4-benzoquinol methylase